MEGFLVLLIYISYFLGFMLLAVLIDWITNKVPVFNRIMTYFVERMYYYDYDDRV